MLRRVKMPCRMLAGRGVATAHIAAGHAFAQRNPSKAFLQACFTDKWYRRRREVSLAHALEMFTGRFHITPPFIYVIIFSGVHQIVPITAGLAFGVALSPNRSRFTGMNSRRGETGLCPRGIVPNSQKQHVE